MNKLAIVVQVSNGPCHRCSISLRSILSIIYTSVYTVTMDKTADRAPILVLRVKCTDTTTVYVCSFTETF